MKRFATMGVLALVVAGLAYLAASMFTGPGRTGEVAPEFTLVDSDGDTFRLSQYRGRPVVLFFMTTSDWCQPCKVETRDHLKPLYSAHAGHAVFISIELLPNDQTDAELNAYKAFYGTPWTYARDTAGVGTAYRITALSTVVIVDPEGYVVFRGVDPPFRQMDGILKGL